ncbi:MAG: RpiB/LacA/LacB family sugar-phosphate isomerase [Oscillospiraceae bacterium]
MKSHLESLGYDITDFGSDNPIYAETAIKVAEYVAENKADRAFLLCGTGIGVSIAANKVKGAFAALITDPYSALRSVKSNNANIACFGAFTIGYKLMETLADIWLSNSYDSGTPSEEKIKRIKDYDKSRS